MADNSDPRELENNSWVIASSEALPVEDLSPEPTEAENVQVKDDPQASLGDGKVPEKDPSSEEPKPKDPEVVPASTSGAIAGPEPAKTPEPLHLEKEPSSSRTEEAVGSRDAESISLPDSQVPLLIRQVGPLEERTNTSSGEEDGSGDRDVEGLRRRKGRDTYSAESGAPHDRHREPVGGKDSVFPGTTWLLGLLAIFGVGILAFSGVAFEAEEGPVDVVSTWPSSEGDEPHLGKDWPAELAPEATAEGRLLRAKGVPPSVTPSDPPSLENMGHLLDKLAKENQEIRLMQAELQAQKEELQSLLRKTEGEALEFTNQHQNLAVENARLSEALRQETSALLAARAELRLLQEKLHSLGEASGAKSPPEEEEERRRDKAEQSEAEVRRLRSLLASVRQDLGRASQPSPPHGEGPKWLPKLLGDVHQRLSQELEQHPEGDKGARPPWREAHKAKRGKEKTWHKRHEGHEDRRSEPHKEHHRFSHKHPKVPGDGPQRPRKHVKPAKDSGHHHHAARKAKKPSEPSALWEMLSQHHYRAPQGCAGVAECAQREGLLPVQKTGFLPMIQNYLARLGWAEHYGGLAAALDPFFDPAGVFAHDRLSFVDLLDEIEDALEDLAQMLGGSEEQVDDFEAVVLQQLGSAPGGRFTPRNGAQHHPKDRNRDGHHPHHKHGWEGAGRAHG